ncbi:MAG: CvpA family protein [Massilibacteroides sp.]|nr:CvpA family protein [Massilibacteroides sp.]MDD3061822.1 CvpA family protein [Massilibacteroides sp.]MDD4114378.1 CvpA family protein [Massilibacteroides sp.]MDD4660104.1 CvpA family protein [Massilibacteroides sp.]
MNWLDILIVCLAGVGFMKGLFDGMIKQVVSLLALLIAIYFCSMAADWLKVYLENLDWFSPETVTIISYILGFILILGVVLLAGEIIHRIVGVTPLSILNHLGGGVFGLALMLLFLSLCLNLFEFIDKKNSLLSPEVKVESRFYYPIYEIMPTIYRGELFNNE